MGRKSKYTTDELISLAKKYAVYKNNLSVIRATELADYCKQQLGLDVSYQMFSRNNTKVKEWIERYNADLQKRVLTSGEHKRIHEESMVMIDSCLADAQEGPLFEKLQSVKSQLASLIDLNHSLSEQYQEAESQRTDLLQQNQAIEGQYRAAKGLSEDQKKELGELKKENKDLRRNLKMIHEYLDKYLYEPVLLAHLQDIKLLPEDADIDVPASADRLMTMEEGSQESIEKFASEVWTEEGLQDELDELPFPVTESDSDHVGVYSKETTELIDRFNDL